MRTVSPLSACATTRSRWRWDSPTITNRGSSVECTGSGTVIDSGSPNTVVASGKDTSCFRKLAVAFSASQVNEEGLSGVRCAFRINPVELSPSGFGKTHWGLYARQAVEGSVEGGSTRVVALSESAGARGRGRNVEACGRTGRGVADGWTQREVQGLLRGPSGSGGGRLMRQLWLAHGRAGVSALREAVRDECSGCHRRDSDPDRCRHARGGRPR